MKVAAVTMVFNEKGNLPIWSKYYGGQLTPSHCYVIDHGSTDGSTQGLTELSRILLPRSPQDDVKRALFVSRLVNSLLGYYDYVLYSDCDEILVPDPRKFSGIVDYCEKVKSYFDIIRYHVDKLELIVDDENWPLPKYRELLFVK